MLVKLERNFYSDLLKFLLHSPGHKRWRKDTEGQRGTHGAQRDREKGSDFQAETPSGLSAPSRDKERYCRHEGGVRPAEHPAAEEAADSCCSTVGVLLPGSG